MSQKSYSFKFCVIIDNLNYGFQRLPTRVVFITMNVFYLNFQISSHSKAADRARSLSQINLFLFSASFDFGVSIRVYKFNQ